MPDPAFRWINEPWGPALRCTLLEQHAQHVFTSKQLRLPDAGGWWAACRSVGGSPDALMRVTQVHGNVVRVLTRGAVPAGAALERPAAGAIVANEPGLILAVMVADCVPVLLADRTTGAVAAIHAGWRGTCARVAPAAVAAMRRHFGTAPSDLVAAIGPSIGPDDYEVGDSLMEAFEAAGHSAGDLARWFVRRSSGRHLDLWFANRDQLTGAGVPGDHVFTCGLSTRSHTDVFDSFRSDGERAGRMAAVIAVSNPPGGGSRPPSPQAELEPHP